MKVERKLTSVHIIENIYKEFKINTIESTITLQKFVNRCVSLYNTDPEFRSKVDNYNNLAISGSKF